MVTSSEDTSVKIWDTRTGSIQRNYAHGSPVNDVVIHPNQGELISCDRGGNVRIWDLGENKCTHQLIPEEDVSISSVTVASDGTLLCAGSNTVSEVLAFALALALCPHQLQNHTTQLINCTSQGNVYVWRLIQNRDLTSLVPVCSFSAHTGYITRVLLSPDVRHLATCSADHNARIWTVTTNPPTSSSSTLNSMQSPPSSFEDISNGIANSQLTYGHTQVNGGPQSHTSGEDIVKRAGFPLESSLESHQRWVWDCAFSADSAYLVTACSDHYARLWELGTQSVIRQYNGHHRGAVCVALNDYSEAR